LTQKRKARRVKLQARDPRYTPDRRWLSALAEMKPEFAEMKPEFRVTEPGIAAAPDCASLHLGYGSREDPAGMS
jgi:hypothetical protein